MPLPSVLRRPTKITAHSTAVVCQDVQIVGDVTIGAGTVVHPKAKISALRGPIVIGENCIVEELAAIVNKYSLLFALLKGSS